MKKLALKINSATKRIVMMLAVAGIVGYSAFSGAPAEKRIASMAYVGLIATFKKKGIELTEDEEKQFKAMDDAFSANLEGLVTSDELKSKFDELKSGMSAESIKKLVDTATEELAEQQKAQAVAIDQLRTMGIGGTDAKGKTLRQQIKEQLTTDENQRILKGMKDKTNANGNISFEVKAAADMTIGTSTAYTTNTTAIAFPQPEFIPGLTDVARNQPFILQLLNVKPTGKANIVYAEKYNPQGSAGWVGENTNASEVSFDIRIGESRAKMVDAYIKVSVQMLDDVDYIASEIEKELIYQIAIKIDTDLLQGDGTGNNLAGISSFAPAYTLTTLTTTAPNNCDAILAAATQIAVANFRPDIAVMNTVDYNQTKLLKGTTGYYLINPNNKDNNWGGILVVPSNQVPVGYTMVMDSSRTNVFTYMGFTLSYGWVNDDFTKNMVTIMASQRLHSFIKSNDENAFVYDTLANIKGAITAV